jgi:phospholipase D1/2
VSSLLGKVTSVVQGLGSEVAQKIGGQPPGPGGQYGTGQYGTQPMYGAQSRLQHRYESFAAQRSGNEVKWHVDGCSYMYAVSRALEMARESIWILDCMLP